MHYLDKKNIYYVDKEIQQLKDINISRHYGRYLQYVFNRHQNNKNVKWAIKNALLIVANYENEHKTTEQTQQTK